jgi:hypothetical protein
MNRSSSFIVAAFALVASATAFAGEATPDYAAAFSSSVSRSAVAQAAVQARAAGQIAQGEFTVVADTTGPALSRAQVIAETREAVRLGAIVQGEQYRFATPAQLQSIQMAGLQALVMSVASR